MAHEEPKFNGRTSLRRRLSYERYILAFRLTMVFFILVQAIPFVLVIVSSIQSHLWGYAVAACAFITVVLAWAVMARAITTIRWWNWGAWPKTHPHRGSSEI